MFYLRGRPPCGTIFELPWVILGLPGSPGRLFRFHLPTLFFNNKQGQVEQKLIRRAQRWISDDFDTFSQYGDWQTEAGAQRQYSLAFEEWSSALRDQVAGAAQAKKLRLNSHLQSTRESHMLNMFRF